MLSNFLCTKYCIVELTDSLIVFFIYFFDDDLFKIDSVN